MKAVIFDLDGTLVDSAAAICTIANVLMDRKGWRPLDLAEAKSFIGHGARHFLKEALEARHVPVTADEFESHFAEFNTIYAAAPGEDNAPYPGVTALLEQLAVRPDIAIGLCTNKPLAPSQSVIAAHGWSDHFATVIAGDSLPKNKPDPLPLQTAIQRTGATQAIFVGDSEVDAATATAAGVPFALYEGGYRKSAIQDLRTDAVFAHHSELPSLIDKLLG